MSELARAVENFCLKNQTIPLSSNLLSEWVLSLCPQHETTCDCVVFISSEVLQQIIMPAYAILKPPKDNSQYELRDVVIKAPTRQARVTLAKFVDSSKLERQLHYSNRLRAEDGVPYILENNPEVKPFRRFSKRLVDRKPNFVVFLVRFAGDFNFCFFADLQTRKLEIVSCVHTKLDGTLVRELENCIVWFLLFQFKRLVIPTLIMRMPILPSFHLCTSLSIFYTFLRVRLALRMELAAPLCVEEKIIHFMHYFFDPNCKELAIGQ